MLFIAYDAICNDQWTQYIHDCFSRYWSKHDIITLNVSDGWYIAVPLLFRLIVGSSLDWFDVESLVTNKELTRTLLGKLNLLFSDLLFNTVSRRVLQWKEGIIYTRKHGFPECPQLRGKAVSPPKSRPLHWVPLWHAERVTTDILAFEPWESPGMRAV